ncbi:hypothetical protein [Streptomyces sp. NPDC059398]|uniref:hypothetical protein n=1 Tax=Streptomyces sp. NPDC059398 TaxID=3346820 RepID=UPI0036A373B2
MPPGPGGSAGSERGDSAPAADRPVFVDASGRRGRQYRRIGWLIALACASYAVLLVATVVGGDSTAPWLLIPGPAHGKKAETGRDPATHAASPAPGVRDPGATPAPVPVNVASAGAPEPATAVSPGVRVTPAPPGTGSARQGGAAESGTSSTSAPPVRAPGAGSADPAPVVSAPPSGGGHSPSPAAPAPSAGPSAPNWPEPSAPAESAP